MNVRFTDPVEIRPGSPFAICSLIVEDADALTLPSRPWQNIHAALEAPELHALAYWEVVDDMPGFRVVICDPKSGTIAESARYDGYCMGLRWVGERLNVSAFPKGSYLLDRTAQKPRKPKAGPLRWTLRVLGTLVGLLVAAFCGIVLYFDHVGFLSSEPREVRRLVSPDSTVDAVLIVAGGGATSVSAYHLYIMPRGKTVDKEEPIVLTVDHVNDLPFRWVRPRLLFVDAMGGRIFRYSNFWESPDVDNYRYIVLIELKQ